MSADPRLYLHFEGRIKDDQFEEYKRFISDIRGCANKAESDFWCPASDGERIIHNGAIANEENFKNHMNEWVPMIGGGQPWHSNELPTWVQDLGLWSEWF